MMKMIKSHIQEGDIEKSSPCLFVDINEMTDENDLHKVLGQLPCLAKLGHNHFKIRTSYRFFGNEQNPCKKNVAKLHQMFHNLLHPAFDHGLKAIIVLFSLVILFIRWSPTFTFIFHFSQCSCDFSMCDQWCFDYGATRDQGVGKLLPLYTTSFTIKIIGHICDLAFIFTTFKV